jgi:hypothetical protein
MNRIYFKYGHCPPDFGPRKEILFYFFQKKKKKKKKIEKPNPQNPPPNRETLGPTD